MSVGCGWQGDFTACLGGLWLAGRLYCLSRWVVAGRRLYCLSRWGVAGRRLYCLSRWVVAGRETLLSV